MEQDYQKILRDSFSHQMICHRGQDNKKLIIDSSDGRIITFVKDMPDSAKQAGSGFLANAYQNAQIGKNGYSQELFGTKEYNLFNSLYQRL